MALLSGINAVGNVLANWGPRVKARVCRTEEEADRLHRVKVKSVDPYSELPFLFTEQLVFYGKIGMVAQNENAPGLDPVNQL